ncbi:MAG: hypothetical protein ABSD57_14945, partial [Verrucomicrobiota bacterium]
FDGTTNDPVVYPNGSSIQNLASQILIQIYSTPSTLPAATNGFPYIGAQFSATGGETPYTWSLGSGTQLPVVGYTLILPPVMQHRFGATNHLNGESSIKTGIPDEK